jgi:hypothetical protein
MKFAARSALLLLIISTTNQVPVKATADRTVILEIVAVMPFNNDANGDVVDGVEAARGEFPY